MMAHFYWGLAGFLVAAVSFFAYCAIVAGKRADQRDEESRIACEEFEKEREVDGS